MTAARGSRNLRRRQRAARVLIALTPALLAGCELRHVELAHHLKPDSGAGPDLGEPISGLHSLRITPDSREATFDGSALASTPVFHALGSFASGERDVSQLVAWSLSRPELGSIDAGRFESAAVGGTSEVLARAGEISARAQLRIRLDISLNRGVSDDVIAAFGGAEKDVRSPSTLQISYPTHDTRIPSNLAHLRYQWRAPDELVNFELLIESNTARLRYFTRDRDWLDDAESSRFLAPSHPGEELRIRVRASAASAPDVIYRSDPVTLGVSAASVPGAALYWSSTARGIKRGELGADHAARVVTDPAGTSAQTCTGCHALSRDGKQLAVANGMDRLELFGGPEWSAQTFTGMAPAPPAPPALPKPGTGKAGMAMPVGDPMAAAMPPMPMPPGMPAMPPMAAAPPMPMRGPADYGWSSFNPDGSQLAYATKGKLHILDPASGKELPKTHLPPDAFVTHPDWSPDGRFIAVAYALSKPPKGSSNKLVRGSGIARLPVLEDGTLGEPELLVASTGPDDTLAFPSYTPDGRWLAFARATGASKDNSTAQLWVVAADGASAPVLIERANRPAGVDLASPSAASNTMPTWAAVSAGKLAFLVFSSARDYGDVLVGAHRDQLWASAIDLELLATGSDPSAPAFWLPFQDPLESNHRALWSTANANECRPSAEVCDGRDDDCDGDVDESCCAPSPEDCGDDVDNDCDGVANEGCDCSDVEVCDNGQDDDCDEHVDEDCRE